VHFNLAIVLAANIISETILRNWSSLLWIKNQIRIPGGMEMDNTNKIEIIRECIDKKMQISILESGKFLVSKRDTILEWSGKIK